MLRAFLDEVICGCPSGHHGRQIARDAKKSVKAELAPRHEKNFPSWNGGAEATIERTYKHIKEKLPVIFETGA